jgi:UPF0755 protein
MKRLFIFITVLFLLTAIGVVGIGAYGWNLFRQPGPLETETTYLLSKGTGLRSLARQLHENNIINNELAFIFGVKYEEKGRLLRAGEYAIPAGISGQDLMDLFVSGKVIVRRLTIPEGLQSREIRELVMQADGLVGEITVETPEGAFLPETYHYHFGESRDEILSRMIRDMEDTVAKLWAENKAVSEIKSPDDLIILASIVEKETGVEEERPRVAGVFINRLKKGMKLQSDPTVVYGITEGKHDLGRPLSRKDLASKTEYNTYQINGLPKGPIANPGLESLRAVLAPMVTKDLFFVADGKGGHAFAETLDDHNRNVQKWRKLNRK